MKRLGVAIARFLASRQFYWGMLGLFVLEALWIAVSSVYPMAFDEDFHLGIIRIYAENGSPFLSGQPDNANMFGAVARDPSFFYHYLMSFPYQIISGITDSVVAQVIFLRLLNIAFFAWGLVLFRRVLLKVGLSPAFTHVAMLLFVLIPIVPMVAGQINYDNMIMPLTAGLCLLTIRLREEFLARRPSLRTLVLFLALAMAGSIVKYAFIPLVLAALVFLAVTFWQSFRGRAKTVRREMAHSYRSLSRRVVIGLALPVIVLGGLVFNRYGINMIKYHTPTPDCAQVLSERDCMAYGPWARNHRMATSKEAFDPNPIGYSWTWLLSMHYRSFFVVNGPAAQFKNYPPLPLPAAAAVVIGVTGIAALLFYWRRVFAGRPLLVFLALLCAGYIGILWFDEYTQFLETGQPVAINGRYLLPLLLPLAALFGAAFRVALRMLPAAKPWLAVIVIAAFLHGGGTLSFILRTDATWNWPEPTVTDTINDSARAVLSLIIFEGSKFY